MAKRRRKAAKKGGAKKKRKRATKKKAAKKTTKRKTAKKRKKTAKKTAKRKARSDAVAYLYDRFIGNDSERLASVAEEEANLDIAQKIYDLRTKAGLSQRQLAKLVGTSASAICRLEDADYEGHSLAMLKRIAAALDQRVEIRFVPVGGTR